MGKRKLQNKEKKKEKKIKKNKKKDKKQDREDNNDNSEPKSDRKYTANKPKDKENDAKIQARLDALGLKSIPSQETLMRLDCIYKKVPQLLENCGKLKLERPYTCYRTNKYDIRYCRHPITPITKKRPLYDI